MRTERGFDRIVNFSDATVAIAMTLLILPLVELGGEEEPGETLGDLFSHHAGEIFGFVVSFLVIWTLWSAHHRAMEYFDTYDSRLLRLHVVWLMTIVALPFTTQLITNPEFYEHGAAAVYIAVLLVSSLCVHLIAAHGRRTPQLLHQDSDTVRAWLAAPMSWTTVILLAVALIVVLVFPSLGAWPLLLLFADNVVDAVRGRRGSSAERVPD